MIRDPYLFIVGCARSGTTLLQRMLDHHPMLAVANEARLMLRVARSETQETDPPLTSELVEWVRSYHRFTQLGLPEAIVDEAAAGARTYGEFASRLYSAYGKVQGKAFAGEKTPRYVRFLPRLHYFFPWVRTIHLIRDGRNVTLSTLEWAQGNKGPARLQLWSKEPVAACALWWQWQVSKGRHDGAKLGRDKYHEVKYEDLISFPKKELRDVTEFLALPFAPEMLAFHSGKQRSKPKLSAKKAWLPPTQGLRDWRTQMSARDVELFEAIAGDLLSTLGYERAFTAVSPSMLRVSKHCRDWWQTNMTRREATRASSLLAKKASATHDAGVIEAAVSRRESETP